MIDYSREEHEARMDAINNPFKGPRTKREQWTEEYMQSLQSNDWNHETETYEEKQNTDN